MALKKLEIQANREKGILSQERAFLKSQFNSHLTFNFLNFIFSQVLKSSERAAEAIGHFSEMLRYTLRAEPGKAISLQQEFDNLLNYVALQKCINRWEDVAILQEGEFSSLNIFPHTFLPILELVTHNEADKPISILLRVTHNDILFHISYLSILPEGYLPNCDRIMKYFDHCYQGCYTLENNTGKGLRSIEFRINQNLNYD